MKYRSLHHQIGTRMWELQDNRTVADARGSVLARVLDTPWDSDCIARLMQKAPDILALLDEAIVELIRHGHNSGADQSMYEDYFALVNYIHDGEPRQD